MCSKTYLFSMFLYRKIQKKVYYPRKPPYYYKYIQKLFLDCKHNFKTFLHHDIINATSTINQQPKLVISI